MWVATGFQATTAFLCWENRFKPGPLLIGQVGQITQRNTPFVAFQCINQPWNHNGAEFPNALSDCAGVATHRRLGLMLLYFAAFKAGLFPIGGTGTIWHLVLPAFAAGMGGAAWYARLMRSSALDVIRADYVRTARAKGLRESSVVLRHILRNAILPIITLVGLDIPWFLSGVVLIEAVFAWPGLGKLAVDAVRNVDVPLILGTVLFTALIVVASNIVTDLLYAFVDPRIRYGE